MCSEWVVRTTGGHRVRGHLLNTEIIIIVTAVDASRLIL